MLVRGASGGGVRVGAPTDASEHAVGALSIESTPYGARRTLKLDGELDLSSALDFFAFVAPLVYDAGVAEIELDLSELTFLDSPGLHLILRLRTLCRENNVALVLRCASKQVTRLLEVTGVAVSVDAD